jgi:hypothetical protein
LHPAVTSPLIGARTLAQLEDNLAAVAVTFNKDQVERLDAASRIDLGFPHEFLASGVTDRMFGSVKVGRREKS